MDNTWIVENLMTIWRLAYIAHCELEVYDQLTDYIWNVWTLALIEDGSLYVIYTILTRNDTIINAPKTVSVAHRPFSDEGLVAIAPPSKNSKK